MTTGVIDEDPAHDAHGYAKEMRPVLPIHPALIDESLVHLVNKRRWLQGVVRAFASKLAGGDPAELRMDEWQQLIPDSSADWVCCVLAQSQVNGSQRRRPVGQRNEDHLRGTGFREFSRMNPMHREGCASGFGSAST